MELSAWQLRAWNLFARGPVYQSNDTTKDRLVLHAAKGFILTPELATRLAALGLIAETRAIKGQPYVEIVIRQA